MSSQTVLFYLYSAVAVAGAVGTVAARQLVHAVMSLFATLLSIAALFLIMGSQFVAAMQLLVYGGAITILVLFVLMLTRRGAQQQITEDRRPRASVRWVATVTCAALFGAVVYALTQTTLPAGAEVSGETTALASFLFSHYIVAFEVAGVILTVALIGAIVLAREDDLEGESP